MDRLEDLDLEQLNYFWGRLGHRYKINSFDFVEVHKKALNYSLDEHEIKVIDTDKNIILYECTGTYNEFSTLRTKYNTEKDVSIMRGLFQEIYSMLDFWIRQAEEKEKGYS
jgi:hypothetical protein